MKSPDELKEIFGRYAGREVPMVEKRHKELLASLEYRYFSETAMMNNDNPVVKEMQEVAQQHGLRLQFDWQGKEGNVSKGEANSVRVEIVRHDDGRWCIANKFVPAS